LLAAIVTAPPAEAGTIELDRDDDAGVLRVVIDGAEAIVYQYAPTCDMPSYRCGARRAGR